LILNLNLEVEGEPSNIQQKWSAIGSEPDHCLFSGTAGELQPILLPWKTKQTASPVNVLAADIAMIA
jgi:hypothetical protein